MNSSLRCMSTLSLFKGLNTVREGMIKLGNEVLPKSVPLLLQGGP